MSKPDAVRAALAELVALVRGECPSLLDEDSGGDARLSMLIDDALAEQPAEPVAWRDHVEHRLRTWRQKIMNRSGDRLALDDFMDADSLEDLVDFVCDEWAEPAPHPAPSVAVPVAPWTDFAGNPIRHGDRLAHPDGDTFVAVRLQGHKDEGDAWRAVYEQSPSISRLGLQIGDKGRAVLAASPQPPTQQEES